MPGPYMTAEEAQKEGYAIDKSSYPWIAYTGPRFEPNLCLPLITPAWPPKDES